MLDKFLIVTESPSRVSTETIFHEPIILFGSSISILHEDKVTNNTVIISKYHILSIVNLIFNSNFGEKSSGINQFTIT